jgi:hypothetical protein
MGGRCWPFNMRQQSHTAAWLCHQPEPAVKREVLIVLSRLPTAPDLGNGEYGDYQPTLL